MREFVDHLTAHGTRCRPGLTDARLEKLERDLKARLPEPARDLYRVCGGVRDRDWTTLPMRLMPPREVVETAAILRECADVYSPARRARYLFTDDGSNWIGIFVSGALRGRLTLLDHDEPTPVPRFRNLP